MISSSLLNSILSLCGIGTLAAAILYIGSKKFYVYEDPKIAEVEQALPGANCGGCGYPGCKNFADATVKAKDLSKLFCPVGGSETMQKVGAILGFEVTIQERSIAVLRCNGSYQNSPEKINYQGASSCTLAHAQFAGVGGCGFGCLHLGDCAVSCKFDALSMDPKTGLPVVDEAKCTACNACVVSCPRNLFELRPEGVDKQRVYVACMNTEKGALAKKNCAVACIGCSKCLKVAPTSGITITNSLSYIPSSVSVAEHGVALVECCPTNSIIGIRIKGEA